MTLKYRKEADSTPSVSNETILATRHQFFFTNKAPLQKHNCLFQPALPFIFP